MVQHHVTGAVRISSERDCYEKWKRTTTRGKTSEGKGRTEASKRRGTCTSKIF